MLKSVKKMALLLAALLLLLSALPALADGTTQLQLTFIGMYATSGGGYAARNLSGTFEVERNGVVVGTITADANGSAPIALNGGGNVVLRPVMDTIPDEIPVNQQGYTVSIVEGRTNFAPVVVYAQAGLFRVHTESQAHFSLISEEGDIVLSFSTDSKGDYSLPTAIPAGQYTLRMDSASLAISKWRDKIISIAPYTGPDSVVYIDASYYYTPQITLRPSTPTPPPTATPAPVTTQAAETPKPTESLPDVQETPATPTPTPTATPKPTSGLLVLQGMGDTGAEASFTVTSGGAVYGQGRLRAGETARVPNLSGGNYIVTVTLPENVLLTGLNGYPSLQRRTAQWLVTITVGRTSSYQVELSLVGGVSGVFAGFEDVQVTITGSEIFTMMADGAFEKTGLTPDTYAVTCVLPAGNYEGEGWSFVESAGHVLAIARAEVRGGSMVTLPPISVREMGSVGGVVYDAAGQPLSGVQVTLTDASGANCGNAVTSADGAWRIADVDTGAYQVQYAAQQGMMIPSAAVNVTEDVMHPALTAYQAAPASLLVRAFVDDNNNGVLGKNEPFLAGVVVSLVSGDSVVATASTDTNGEATLYAPAGEYVLRCEMPEDYGYASRGSKNLISNSCMEQSSDRVQEATVALSLDAQAEFGVGAAQMSAVSGTVWHDVNGDGLWQAEEPGVAGMTVAADGARNGLHYETVTDANGSFEIRQIRNGTYNISYYVPDGYVFTYKASGPKQQRSLMTTEADRVGRDQIVFDKGDVVTEQNVGLVSESIVEGVCFLDANYNGIFDEGEQVLPGVELELFRQSNNKRLKTVTSDENGAYRFTGVRSDTFKVKALLPQGYTFSINVPGNADANQFAPRDGRREQQVLNIEAVNGESTRVLVGAISYGSISGVAYFDDNFSGSWETGEKIASGIVVTLLDAEGQAIKSAKTNKNGAYTFDNLAPGEYTLSITAKSDYAFTTAGDGSVVENDGVGLGVSAPVSIALGQSITGMNAGMIQPARVTGVVFEDANDNGLYDSGEQGLRGAAVTLMNADGPVETQQVSANGAFTFAPVLPGRYYLRYELPDAGVFSPVADGGNQVVGEGSDGAGDWFEVTVSQTYTAPVCGGLHLASIGGYTFGDSDGSGALDGSERRLAGVTLILTPSRSDLEQWAIQTGVDGSFSFEGLRPDTYQLTVACPNGYVLSLLPDVTLPLVHGLSEQTVTVEAVTGSAWLEQPLGCVMPAAYSGSAWLDENLNGLRDASERAAVREEIEMVEQRSGDVVARLTTGSDGSFRAEGLAPGMYTLRYALADDVQGAQPGDSTFVEVGGWLEMADVAIAEGTDVSGALLGLVRETTLAGHVWLDNDGRTEMVGGAQVTLYCGGTVLAEIETQEDGLYTFDGLMPGQYSIRVVLPAGLLALEPNDRRLAQGDMISILESLEVSGGHSGVIELRMAEHQLQMDIGSVKTGRLGDLCWLDVNANGLQDEGELGIPGVTIELMRDGSCIATTVSDQYGYYVFERLYPGEYTLRVTAPAQVRPTQLRTDLPLIVSVLNENGETGLLPVVSGGANYAADLGFVLINEKELPAGYGEGAAQDWTKLR